MITLFIELMLRRREQVSPSYDSGHHKSFAWFKILGLTYTEEIEQKPNNNLTLFYLGEVFNPILHGGGGQKDPPDWLLYANPQGMPQMGWFFMTLFLSILERSWVGHFWDFFLKNPKNFTSTIFSTYNPKGGPFYASVRTPSPSIFLSFFESKMVIIQLQMH